MITKKQFISELTSVRPLDVKTLLLVYHNDKTGLWCTYEYDCSTSSGGYQLTLAILSAYKLRGCLRFGLLTLKSGVPLVFTSDSAEPLPTTNLSHFINTYNFSK